MDTGLIWYAIYGVAGFTALLLIVYKDL